MRAAVRLRITHRLNAHFVDAASPGVEVSEHDGVKVSIGVQKPEDSVFAIVTCSGVVEITERDTECGAQKGPAGQMTPTLILDGRFLVPLGAPAIADDEIASAYERADSILHRVGALIRWRFNLSGRDAVFSDVSATILTDGAGDIELEPIASFGFGDDRAAIPSGGVAELLAMASADEHEPLAHQLLREAWNLRHTNPRASLVIGVASAEVGLKQVIAQLVPDARWLIEEIAAPPLSRMVKEYLPRLPIRAPVESSRRSPKQLRRTLHVAVEERNAVVHRGAKPEVSLRETLAAVREFLYLLDFYRGKQWAACHLSNETRSELGLPAVPDS
jgi:hypothetical protein